MTDIRLEAISKHYGAFRAADNVDLAVAQGEFVTILGPSGSGKTTLLSLIAGLSQPTLGRILIGGRDVTGSAPQQRNVGLVFQSYALFPHMSVFDNVAFPLRVRKTSGDELRRKVMAALDLVQLGQLAERRPSQLSGGQQQRVAIARALMQQPRIILADEPVASLDPRNSQIVMDALRDVNRRDGITVLVNLHHLDTAREYCDRIVAMQQGRVMFEGAPNQLTAAKVREVYGVTEEEFEAQAGADEARLHAPAAA